MEVIVEAAKRFLFGTPSSMTSFSIDILMCRGWFQPPQEYRIHNCLLFKSEGNMLLDALCSKQLFCSSIYTTSSMTPNTSFDTLIIETEILFVTDVVPRVVDILGLSEGFMR